MPLEGAPCTSLGTGRQCRSFLPPEPLGAPSDYAQTATFLIGGSALVPEGASSGGDGLTGVRVEPVGRPLFGVREAAQGRDGGDGRDAAVGHGVRQRGAGAEA